MPVRQQDHGPIPHSAFSCSFEQVEHFLRGENRHTTVFASHAMGLVNRDRDYGCSCHGVRPLIFSDLTAVESGLVVLWSCGLVVLWSCGLVVLWSCGLVASE